MLRTPILPLLVLAALCAPLSAQKARVALTPLQVEGEGLAAQREALGNFLEQELLKSKAVSVVAAADVAGLTGAAVDLELAAKAGKLLKAGRLVWGKLANDGGRLSFWLKMVDTESGELLFSKSYAAEGTAATRQEFEKQTLLIGNDLVSVLTGRGPDSRELTITVVGAAGLVSKDAMSSPDPYVAVMVGDRIIGTTTFKQNRKNPVWYESFTCTYRGEKIQFALFDRDLTKDEYIGNCEVAEPKDGTFEVTAGGGKKVGSLMAEFKFAK